VSGAQRIKLKRGRPKGTARLPASYWLAIIQIVDEVQRKRGRGVEDACRIICNKKGGLRWRACDYQHTGKVGIKTLSQIVNAKVLSNRYYKALRALRLVWHNNIPIDGPRIPRHRLFVYRYPGLDTAGLATALSKNDPVKIAAILRGRYDERGRLRKELVRHEQLVFMPNLIDLAGRK
jgi:hypothetical protein